MNKYIFRFLVLLMPMLSLVSGITAQTVCNGFRTQTQGGWGSNASGNNPGAYRDANFNAAFPNGLVIGDPAKHQVIFTTSAAVNAFLPAGGSANKLTADLTNPRNTPAGVLAGQLTALTLSVVFDEYDPGFSSSTTLLKYQVIQLAGSPFNGMRVGEFLEIANRVIGGTSNAYTPSQLNVTATALNENYVDGTANKGNLVCPPAPVVSGTTVDVKCFGGSSGSINLNVTSGTPPYTYQWSNSATTEDNIDLVAGNYSVLVTDANQMTATASFNINEPPQIVVSETHTDLLCYNVPTGSANLMASGGTGSFAWSMDGLVFQPSPVFQDLAAGNYTFTAKDENGCLMPVSVEITQPAELVITVQSQTNIACYGDASGSVTLNASGGTGNHYLSIDGVRFSNSSVFDNLTAGTYTITLKDDNNCVTTQEITITQPSAPLSGSVMAQVNILCHGDNTGSIRVAGAGGTAPYTYSIDGNTFQTLGSFSQLSAGDYTVTIKDANQCKATVSVTLTEPTAPLSIALSSSTQILCYGENTGAINMQASGGTSPYQFAMNASGFQQQSNFQNLNAGTYVITAKDTNGCVARDTVILSQPASALSVTISNQTSILCYGELTGSASANATGGTSPYTYLWSNQNQTENITGVGAGSYQVDVTDNNGCKANTSVTLTQPASALSLTVSSQQNVSCNALSNGSVSISANGGTAPYQYSANGIDFSSTSSFSGLAAGTYQFYVKDTNNCQQTTTVVITEPVVLSVQMTSTNVTTYAGNNGSITTTVTGGTSPYTYLWSNQATTANLSNIAAGVYAVTITDANGCKTEASVTITQPSGSCNGYRTQTQGGWGSTPSGNNPGSYLHAHFAAAFPNGLEIGCNNKLRLTTAQAVTDFLPSGSSASALPSGTLTNPGSGYNNVLAGQLVAATLSITFDAYDTDFGSNASLLRDARIGSGTFQGWSVQQVIAEANRKIGGCTSAYSFSDLNAALSRINENFVDGNVTGSFLVCNTMVLTSQFVQPTCASANNGTATVSITGGQSPYRYSWSNGDTTATASNLSAGSYTVTVTDQMGFTSTHTVVVTAPAPLQVTIQPINATCISGNTGSLLASATGGVGTYTYLWNNTPASSIDSANKLAAGNYTVTVTDANGCLANASATVSSKPQAWAYINDADELTQMLPGNNFVFVTYNNLAGETYSWDFGDGTTSDFMSPNKSYSGIGIYNVSMTATNAAGCSNTTYLSVVVLPASKSMDQVPNCNPVRKPLVITQTAIFPRNLTDWSGSALKTQKVAPFDTQLGKLVGLKVINKSDFTTNNKVEITGNMAAGTKRLVSIQTTGTMSCAGPGFLYQISPISILDTFYATGFDGVIDYAGTSGRDFGFHTSIGIDSTIIADSAILAQYSGLDSVTFTAHTRTMTNSVFPTGNSKSIVRTYASDTVIIQYYYCPPVNCNTLAVSHTTKDATCNANVGSINLTITGGEAPYTVSCNNQTYEGNITGLAAGTYQYTVTDINGCSVSGSATIGVEQITIYAVSSGDWNNPSTWDVGRVPTICDDVVIARDYSVTVNPGYPTAQCKDLTCSGTSELLIYDTLECRNYVSTSDGQETRVFGFLSVCTMLIDDNADVYACDNIAISNCTRINKPLQVINAGEMHPLGSPYCTTKPKVSFKNDSTDIDLSDVCSAIDVDDMEIAYGYVTMPPCLTIHGVVTVQPGGDVLGFEPTWAPTSSLVMNRVYTFDQYGTSTILWPNGNTNVPRTITLTSNITILSPKTIVDRINVIDSTVQGAGFIILENGAMVYICGGNFSSPPTYGNNVTTQYCDVQPGNPPAVIGNNMPPGGFTGDLIISTNVQLGENISVAGNVLVNSTGILYDSVFNFTSAQSVLVDSGAVVYISKNGGLSGSESLFGSIPSAISCGSTVVYVADSGSQQIDPRMDYGTVVLDGTAPKEFQSADYGICGDLTITESSGSVDMPVESNIILAGNVDQTVSTAEPVTVFDITATGTGTKEISGEVTVIGTLQVEPGVTVITGNQLTLVSDGTRDAIVGPLVNGADIQGTICWERFIPGGSSRRRWRFLSMPIWNQTFKDAWQDDIFITGPGTGGRPCDYNTTSTTSMIQNSNGFDVNETGANTIFTWSELTGTWSTIQSAYDTIYPLSAYRTYVRGARYVEGCLLLTLQPDSVSATLIDACGPLVKFDQSVNLTRTANKGNGWNYVSNPYPCPIDWNHPEWVAARAGIVDPTLWIFDPATNAYATWHPTAGATNGGSNIIGKDQSIFVRALQPGVMTFKEQYKVDTLKAGFFGKTTTVALNRLAIKLTGANSKDEAVVYMHQDATHNYNPSLDGFKPVFEEGSLAATKKGMPGEHLIYAAIPVVAKSDTVKLFTNLGELNATYTLSFDGLAEINGYTYYLRDNFINSNVLLSTNTREYKFAVNALESNSFAGNRFEIIIVKTASTPVAMVTLKAVKNNANVDLVWATGSEKNNSHFVVEYSTDAINFVELGSVKGAGNTSKLTNYLYAHTTPVNGINYYRLRQVNVDGTFNTSAVVSVDMSVRSVVSSTITVFPVPATNQITVQFENMNTTKQVSIAVVDLVGRTIIERNTGINGNKLTLDIQSLKPGAYFVSINEGNGEVKQVKFIKE